MPNIVNNVVRFDNICISVSSRGVLILSEALLVVLLKVVMSKGEFSLDVFSTD